MIIPFEVLIAFLSLLSAYTCRQLISLKNDLTKSKKHILAITEVLVDLQKKQHERVNLENPIFKIAENSIRFRDN